MNLDIWQYGALFLASLVAGFLNVLAGGGSLLTIPIMLFSGIEAPVANGTNRIGLLAQNFSAIATFFKKGYSDIRLCLSLSVCALPGAIVGAYLGVDFEGVWFNRTIAIIMICVMFITLYKPGKRSKKNDITHSNSHKKSTYKTSKSRNIWGHILMVAIGFYGGVIQMGVGFLFPFVLHRVMGIDLVLSNLFKVFVIFVYTIIAIIIFASHDSIIWLLGLLLAIGNSIGAYFGVNASIKRGEKLIIWVLNATLAVFAIKLLFF